MLSLKVFIKRVFPNIFSLLKSIKELIYAYLGKKHPELLVKRLYREYYGRRINLKSPKDIDEKVNYMKLYTDTSMWSILADKYEVREYVKRMGLSHTLNELYGVYDSPEEIDFNTLPNQFVIKTTNGGGGNSVLIVKDKNSIDTQQVIAKLKEWLMIPMAYKYAESHYGKIKPRLIIEKYLQCPEDATSLIDYKFNSFNGNVYTVFLCSDREFGKQVKYSVYDLEWNLYPEKVKPEYATDTKYAKPSSLKKMIEYSSILSKGFPYVRIDWYEVEGEPIFGEMTFTPAGGFQQFYNYEYLLELGEQCQIEIDK